METDNLKKLREPFKPKQIGKLPKPTAAQTKSVKENFRNGIRCTDCGQWHHEKVVHLDYVGHAALTDRFLNVDPLWNWEPLAMDENGMPFVDGDCLWIKLTICGMTRIGVGDSGGKDGGNAMKERIGDALRNAGMRFGAALDLWHKGDLHNDEPEKDINWTVLTGFGNEIKSIAASKSTPEQKKKSLNELADRWLTHCEEKRENQETLNQGNLLIQEAQK